MKLADFDYQLPEELIAQEPLLERDASRLLVLHRKTGQIEHRSFLDVVKYLVPGDLVVMNNSRVIRARLIGTRESGGKVEALLLRDRGQGVWEALVRPGRKVLVGTKLRFGDDLTGEVLDRTEEGGRLIRLASSGDIDRAIEVAGEVPLPPYIHKKIADPERYQTVYADQPGSVAAPTAGLHFTPRVLQNLRDAGVQTAFVTLHVGLGTFRPVQVEDIEDHRMHEEHYSISDEVAAMIHQTRASGHRLLAVGTTVARTLESSRAALDQQHGTSGWTSLFIYPGYQFGVVDAMLTNFHLPKSSLLMMISALAGRDLIRSAYEEAIKERYRFFSFGDAMLII